MKTLKRLSLCLSAASLLLLPACGGSDEPAAPGAPGAPAVPAAAPAAPKSPGRASGPVGDWHLDTSAMKERYEKDMQKVTQKSGEMGGAMAQMAIAMAKNQMEAFLKMELDIQLLSGGKAVFKGKNPDGKEIAGEGSWTQAGELVTVTPPPEASEKGIAETMELVLSGDTLAIKEETDMGKGMEKMGAPPMVFRRR